MVVVSLIFVTYSIQQNTRQLRLQNENFLFDKMQASLDIMVVEPSFADIVHQIENGQDLSPTARIRYTAYLYQRVNLWEMAYYWNRDGYLDPQSWEEWDDFFALSLDAAIPYDFWVEMRAAYSADFVDHAEEKYRAVRKAAEDLPAAR